MKVANGDQRLAEDEAIELIGEQHSPHPIGAEEVPGPEGLEAAEPGIGRGETDGSYTGSTDITERHPEDNSHEIFIPVGGEDEAGEEDEGGDGGGEDGGDHKDLLKDLLATRTCFIHLPSLAYHTATVVDTGNITTAMRTSDENLERENLPESGQRFFFSANALSRANPKLPSEWVPYS